MFPRILLLSACTWLAPFASTLADPPKKDTPARTDKFGDALPPGAFVRLGSIRLRHAAGVRRVAFVSGGKEIVSCGDDGNVHRWDTISGRRIASFRASRTQDPTALTSAPLALSADGRVLASSLDGEKGQAVSVWDTTTGKCIAKLKNEVLFAQIGSGAVALSPDGKLLLTSSLDGTLRLWDLATGRTLRKVEKTGLGFRVLSFAPHGKEVAAAGDGLPNGVALWDLKVGKRMCALGSGTSVIAVAFAPGGKALASRTRGGRVHLWDPATGKELWSVQEK